jgi:hypothetical protein
MKLMMLVVVRRAGREGENSGQAPPCIYQIARAGSGYLWASVAPRDSASVDLRALPGPNSKLSVFVIFNHNQ